MRKRSYRSALAKIMPRAYLVLARGTAEEAAAYCKKDGRFREMGQLTDMAAVAEAAGAAEKERWALALRAAEEDRLDDVPPDILIRHYGNLVKIRAAHQRVPDSISELDNWWYFGETGTGKSWTARRENPGYYIKNKNRWWDGYSGPVSP